MSDDRPVLDYARSTSKGAHPAFILLSIAVGIGGFVAECFLAETGGWWVTLCTPVVITVLASAAFKGPLWWAGAVVGNLVYTVVYLVVVIYALATAREIFPTPIFVYVLNFVANAIIALLKLFISGVTVYLLAFLFSPAVLKAFQEDTPAQPVLPVPDDRQNNS